MRKVQSNQAEVVTQATIKLMRPIKAHTHKEVVDVQNRLNNRPRKILDYKTPAEVFFDTITKSYSII
ncbi:MAG: hypothetical protein WC667_10445 [Sulfurimonas sp.]|jgi:hypothetical protein